MIDFAYWLLGVAATLWAARVSVEWAPKKHHHWKRWLTIPAAACTLIGSAGLVVAWLSPAEKPAVTANSVGTISSNSGIVAPGATGPITQYNTTTSAPPPNTPAFHLTRGATFIHTLPVGPNETTYLNAVKVKPDDTYVLYPISLFFFVTLTNTHDRPETILGFDVQDKHSGGWRSLCSVYFFDNLRLFWVASPVMARELSTDKMLDKVLANKQIGPSQVVSGWVAASCPTAEPCGSTVRMRLHAASGDIYTQDLPLNDGTQVPEIVSGDWEIFGGGIDLRQHKALIGPTGCATGR